MTKINIEEDDIKTVFSNTKPPEYFSKHIDDVLNEVSPRRRIRWPFPKIAAIAAAAVLIISGSVFAATQIYNFNISQTGEHSVDVGVDAGDTASGESSTIQNGGTSAKKMLEDVEPVLNFIPDDIEAGYKGENSFKAADDERGYFVSTLYMDTDETFTQDFVTNFENVEVGGRTAAYISQQNGTDKTWLWQDLYIAYPEYERIVLLSGWGRAGKDELFKIAEGIELKPTGKQLSADELNSLSKYIEIMNKDNEEDSVEADITTTVTEDKMVNLHKTGDKFNISSFEFDNADDGPVHLTAQVSDAAISDDFSALDDEYIPDEWKGLIGPDGKLLQGKKEYIRLGNGTDTLDEVVFEEDVPLKLVYVDVNFTNNGSAADNLYFFASLMNIEKNGGTYSISDGASDAVSPSDYDITSEEGMVGVGEMFYYDIHGGERNNNYIPHLEVGQTQTIRFAWIVDASVTGNLYLNLSDAEWASFTDEMLETGLVELDLK